MMLELTRSENRVFSFDAIAPQYDETRNLHPGLHHALASHIKRDLGNRKSFLEVGVGTGRIARSLTPTTSPLFGVDISTSMMHHARDSGVSLYHCRAEKLPFASQSMDLVFSMDVLQLIPQWRSALVQQALVAREYVVIADLKVDVRKRSSGTAWSTFASDYFTVAKQHDQDLLPAPGITPGLLIKTLLPNNAISLGPFYDYPTGDELLRPFLSKSFIFQESLPQDEHIRVMENLRNSYHEAPWERRWILHLYYWSPRTILQNLRASEKSIQSSIEIGITMTTDFSLTDDPITVLRCPHTGERLHLVDRTRLSDTLDKIRISVNPRAPHAGLWFDDVSGVLTNASNSIYYPIANGIISLLAATSLPE